MTRWFKDSMSFASANAQGFDQDHVHAQDSFGPAIGLVLAAGTSLVLWFGVAHAASWAAQTFF